jgi:hypothetical protein
MTFMALLRAAFCMILGVLFAVEGIRHGGLTNWGLCSLSFFLASTNLQLGGER